VQEAIAAPVHTVRPDPTSYYLQVVLISAAALLLLAVAVRLGALLPWEAWARALATWYHGQPEWRQWVFLGVVLGVYYLSPWTLPSLLALGCAAVLTYMRLDIGLAYQVISIPFFLFPKDIFGKSFSMVETLTLLCLAAWLVRWLRREILRSDFGSSLSSLRSWGSDWLRSWNALDWAVASFVLLAALSLLVSSNRGVSIREFRVIIVEPVLLYFLLRESNLGDEQLTRLADALLLAGLAVCAVGLHQYFVSGDVIVAEGVNRMRGVYASPNNLSLLLGRVTVFALAVLWAGGPRRRLLYGLALVPLGLSLFLTYSRGGWLLSLPAGLLAIGGLRGRRATAVAVVAVALCVLLLLPLVGTQRILSLLDVDQGTTFYRLKLWQAAVAMIRDHPLTGVGLDNFLYRYPEYMLREAWQEPGLSHPHNIVLDYWTRLGIGGVLVWVWLQAAFFKLALRLYQRLPDGSVRAIILGLIASMVAAVAHGMIDNFYFLVDLAFIFTLSLGLVRSAGLGHPEGEYAR
jgi:O-antigen ligase